MANALKNGSLLQDVAQKSGLQLNTNTYFQSQERPRNLHWLNVGLEVPLSDGTTAMVTLPMGIAIDNMKVSYPTGGDSRGAQIRMVQAAVVESLQEMFANMAEGERRDIPELKVQAYKAPANPDQSGKYNAKQAVASVLHSTQGNPVTSEPENDSDLPF